MSKRSAYVEIEIDDYFRIMEDSAKYRVIATMLRHYIQHDFELYGKTNTGLCVLRMLERLEHDGEEVKP
jgi:malate synthase